MNRNQLLIAPLDQRLLGNLTAKINNALETYSDRDWKYSRISLQIRPLDSIKSPYVMWLELLPTKKKQGQNDLRVLMSEIAWGERHSNELGILEIISLRVNKALLEAGSDDHWDFVRPIVRIVNREALLLQGIPNALWYEIHEVIGEEFDNR
jgi:hypothetical protein